MTDRDTFAAAAPPSAASAGSPTAMAHKGAVYDRTGSRCNCAAYLADGDSGGSSFVDWNTWTKPAARRVYSSDSTVMQGNGAARIAAEVIRRTRRISGGDERASHDA